LKAKSPIQWLLNNFPSFNPPPSRHPPIPFPLTSLPQLPLRPAPFIHHPSPSPLPLLLSTAHPPAPYLVCLCHSLALPRILCAAFPRPLSTPNISIPLHHKNAAFPPMSYVLLYLPLHHRYIHGPLLPPALELLYQLSPHPSTPFPGPSIAQHPPPTPSPILYLLPSLPLPHSLPLILTSPPAPMSTHPHRPLSRLSPRIPLPSLPPFSSYTDRPPSVSEVPFYTLTPELYRLAPFLFPLRPPPPAFALIPLIQPLPRLTRG
jgi:hypothetical protein